mmetsp:Transcript_1630/g.2197  ORF Transcript_1630/g.2197 Transcript_1630/m.2197 type:complete len:563 (+) Transcript_1630:84-1772(+)
MTKMNIALTLLSAIAYLARGADSARDPDMSLVNLPESTSPGGRCMDGTMAGYLIRDGTNPSLFVIDLKGGGACTTQEECDARVNSVRGTSRDWNVDMVGLGFLSQDCDENPDFCEATAVHVPYCTSDTHRGTNDQPSELSWGYYFDGHLNFVAIIEKLIAEKGLGDATNVLLTGGSAGAVGALFNVDWLADRLPNATVKTAPSAGWYSPNALDDDLPVPHQPSDFDHFSRGENGNPFYNSIQAGVVPVDVWKAKNSMSPDCLAAYSDDEWWSCLSARWAYKYIKSPIYMIHTQYDSNQIFSGNQAPHAPVNDTELDAVKRYIQMWGNATRESLEETIVIDDVAFPKAHSDGIFSASCITHGTPGNVAIDGYYVNPLVHDWFFQNGKYDADKYKLIESCEPLEGNEEYVIPCNSATACAYKGNGGGEKEVVMRCAKRLDMEGCLQSFGPKKDCFSCARDNTDALVEAGCTSKIVELVCKYAEENDIFDEFEGRMVDVDFDELDNPDDDCIFKSECEDSSDGIGSSSGAVIRYAPAYGSVLMLGMITFLVVSSPFINLCNIIIL